jgi:hypothetical protein
MSSQVMGAVNRITDLIWPGVVAVPLMTIGGTVALYLRIAGIPTYGIQGFLNDGGGGQHGRDERMLIKSFY